MSGEPLYIKRKTIFYDKGNIEDKKVAIKTLDYLSQP